MTTNEEIDLAVATIIDAVKVASFFYAPLAVAEPGIAMFLRYQAAILKTGIADGTIVKDKHGGLVPFTNSRVMPDGSLRDYDPAIDGQPQPLK